MQHIDLSGSATSLEWCSCGQKEIGEVGLEGRIEGLPVARIFKFPKEDKDASCPGKNIDSDQNHREKKIGNTEIR